MKIRRLEERDVLYVADLAMRTFKKYNGSDYLIDHMGLKTYNMEKVFD